MKTYGMVFALVLVGVGPFCLQYVEAFEITGESETVVRRPGHIGTAVRPDTHRYYRTSKASDRNNNMSEKKREFFLGKDVNTKDQESLRYQLKVAGYPKTRDQEYQIEEFEIDSINE